MLPPCYHGDQPDMSLLHLVLIGEILRAEETLLGLLAEVLQTCGLVPLADEGAEPAAIQRRPRQGTLHARQRSGVTPRKASGARDGSVHTDLQG